jgi:DNA-binding MarR family transcriptional regulator
VSVCVLHVYSSLACTVRQEAHLVALRQAGEHTSAELAELFGVARFTVCRAIDRAAQATPESGMAATVPA